MQMGNPDEATNLFKKARDLIKSIPTAPKKSDAQLRGKDFESLNSHGKLVRNIRHYFTRKNSTLRFLQGLIAVKDSWWVY
jgi:hypothetical protein